MKRISDRVKGDIRMVSPSDDVLEFDAFDVPAKAFRMKELGR
jgi:hypothetical protein